MTPQAPSAQPPYPSPKDHASGLGSRPVVELEEDGTWEPAFDPAWLRRMHPRCLWDGGEVAPRSEFCSPQCFELYELWQSLFSRRHPGIDYAVERRLTAGGDQDDRVESSGSGREG